MLIVKFQKPMLFFLLLLVVSALSEDTEETKRLAKIEALEKQQSELFKQISDAIDDSVKNLEESNDTDSKLGIKLITGLKQQLEVLNGTDDTDVDVKYYSQSSEISNKTRRTSGKEGKAAILEDDEKNSLRNAEKAHSKHDKLFQDILWVDRNKKEKYKERLENRERMSARVEEWLAKKAEAKKIKIYMNSNRKSKETCPPFGESQKKKKKGSKQKFKGYYPCCRKCCKKSYLGCL